MNSQSEFIIDINLAGLDFRYSLAASICCKQLDMLPDGNEIYYELASNKVLGYPTEIFDFVLGEVLTSYRVLNEMKNISILRSKNIEQTKFAYRLKSFASKSFTNQRMNW